MRGTWIILLIMVAAGAGMYFWFGRKPKPANYDTIAFNNTPDSIIERMQVYLADDPKEILCLDSVWMTSDSVKLKQVLNGVTRDTMSKQYSNITLFIAYNNRVYYDLELKKPNPKMAYTIDLKVEPQNSDTLLLEGMIRPQEGDALAFKVPMMKQYTQFTITYNYKLPKQETDSTAIRGHDPNKTITILKN